MCKYTPARKMNASVASFIHKAPSHISVAASGHVFVCQLLRCHGGLHESRRIAVCCRCLFVFFVLLCILCLWNVRHTIKICMYYYIIFHLNNIVSSTINLNPSVTRTCFPDFQHVFPFKAFHLIFLKQKEYVSIKILFLKSSPTFFEIHPYKQRHLQKDFNRHEDSARIFSQCERWDEIYTNMA